MKKHIGWLLALITGVVLLTLPVWWVSLLGFALVVVSSTVLFRDNHLILRILAFFMFILLWWDITSHLHLMQPYILPSPSDVWHIIVSQHTIIAKHLWYTLSISYVGLLLSLLFGTLLAIIMHAIRPLEDLLYPLMVLSQATPTIAVAPLIILWFGFGRGPKIGVVVWVTFFPITVNTLLGLHSIDKDMVDVMKAMGASRWQIFRHITLPHTLAYTLTGLEITSPYAILGALTAEWMGTTQGLGLYIKRSFSSFELPQVFAGTLIITVFSLLTWATVAYIKNIFTKWREGGSML
ncbi:ABC transporter permease subunit [bacterium 3DAC]|nr:ABC transporter permease subunit [bacterium 3DAC]